MNSNFQKGILILLSVFSSQVFAAASSQTSSDNHFYLGAMLGATSVMDEESTNNPIYDKHTLGASGATGGLLAGYNYHLRHQWWLALEVFLNTARVNIADNQNYAPQSSYTVDLQGNGGIRILPAYAFTSDTSGHLILGLALANFKIKDTGNYGIISKTYSQSGFETGLGLDTALSQHVTLRGDVIYTSYASMYANGVTITVPAGIQNYRNNLSTLEANLSIIYNV